MNVGAPVKDRVASVLGVLESERGFGLVSVSPSDEDETAAGSM